MPDLISHLRKSGIHNSAFTALARHPKTPIPRVNLSSYPHLSQRFFSIAPLRMIPFRLIGGGLPLDTTLRELYRSNPQLPTLYSRASNQRIIDQSNHGAATAR